MNQICSEKTSRPEPLLRQCLREEMESGIDMAADPANANLPDLAIRITTVYSPWYARACPVCRHKFREGDRVRLCPECDRPYHEDDQYGLHCWHNHFASGDICAKGGVDRFSEVQREIPRCEYVWSESSEKPARTCHNAGDKQPHVSPGAPLVTQFVTGLERVWKPFGEHKIEKVSFESRLVGRNCPWCRFRIRAGDWVVKCPCGCGTYFHQDVFRHLTCWNEWNGVEGNEYCPITGLKFDV